MLGVAVRDPPDNTEDSDTKSLPGVAPSAMISTVLLRQRVADEVSLAAMDWWAVREVRRESHRVPSVAHCESTILRTLDGKCFTDFSVVLAHTTLTLETQGKRRRDEVAAQGQGSSDAAEALPPCTAVDSTSLSTLEFNTLHFVHRFKENVGYEVQSVWVPGKPLELQCYARLNLQFALLMFMRAQYGAPPGPGASWDVARLAPPCCGDVVILGMGGNVMANCLVQLLPSTVKIRVVEIEPSVVAMCTMEGLLPDAPNFVTHIADVTHAVEQLDDASCALIVLDCFDPVEGDMMAHRHWLSLIRRKLRTPAHASMDGGGGGVLVVNVHCPATAKYLCSFTEVFGSGCVEVLELDSRPAQIVVVCGRGAFPLISRDAFCGLATAVNGTMTERSDTTKGSALTSFPFDDDIVSGYRTLRLQPSLIASHKAPADQASSASADGETSSCRIWRRSNHR